MPYPDFTELSFGYCFLRELEKQYVHGGQFPKAPDFISQKQEAKDGYDVKVAMNNATPLFIQLKRSMVIGHPAATEFAHPYFNEDPVYRMKLHPNGQFQQHKALQDLQNKGAAVIYATSQIDSAFELAEHCRLGSVISRASAIFEPNEIDLPDLTGQHWVSFYADDPFGIVFSKDGKKFERQFPNAKKWLSGLFKKSASSDNNQTQMTEVCKILRQNFSKFDEELVMARPLSDSPVMEASYLAYFLLGAQLTFVKADPDADVKER